MTGDQVAVVVVLWLVVLAIGALLLVLFEQVERTYREGVGEARAVITAGGELPDVDVLEPSGVVSIPHPSQSVVSLLLFLNTGCRACERLVQAMARGKGPSVPIRLVVLTGVGYPDLFNELPSNVEVLASADPFEARRHFGIGAVPLVYVLSGRSVLAGETIGSIDELVTLYEGAIEPKSNDNLVSVQ